MKSRFSPAVGFLKRESQSQKMTAFWKSNQLSFLFLGLMFMKYASVVPKEIVSIAKDFFVHPIGLLVLPNEIMEENVNWSYCKTICFMKRRERKVAAHLLLHYFLDKQSGFYTYTRKIRFHFQPRSFL
jgi:hypothetical protein